MSGQDALRDLIHEQIDDLETTTKLLTHEPSTEGSAAQSVIADDLNEIRHAVATTEDAVPPVPAVPATEEIEDRG